MATWAAKARPGFESTDITASGNITGNVTGDVTGDVTGNVTGDVTGEVTSLGTVVPYADGVGETGTGGINRMYRYNLPNGDICTEIQLDITGLDSSGTPDDVIGLSTGEAAHLTQNFVATNGIIYKVEMSCLEVPTDGDADIILVSGSASDEAFDDTVAGSAAICDGEGDWGLGETVVYIGGITANHYLYLTQGGSDDATYTAGQFLIRLYGHAAIA